jgi:thiamine biosynthesis lipoprotein
MSLAFSRHRVSTIAVVCFILLFALLGAARGEQRFEAVEPHMGTLVRIKVFAADQQQARQAFRAAFDRIAQLDSILSDYQPESELNRLCRAAAGQPVPVSEDLLRVLAASQDLAAQTGGAFDVTLGPVIRLWRQAQKDNRLPDSASLREASARCGYAKLHLDPQRLAVTLEAPGMQLDLGGIAKGYAADAALETLRERGVRSALVAISGDIVCGDPPPGKQGWRIAADPLPEPGATFASLLELSNAAISTSGDTEQHLDANGVRYSHIVDPSTGQGIASGIGVSIVARHGMEADGLATAVSLLGVKRGLALVDSKAETAALIAVRENGKTRLVESARFRDLTAGTGTRHGSPPSVGSTLPN